MLLKTSIIQYDSYFFYNAELIAFVHDLFEDYILIRSFIISFQRNELVLVIPKPNNLSSDCDFDNRIFSRNVKFFFGGPFVSFVTNDLFEYSILFAYALHEK